MTRTRIIRGPVVAALAVAALCGCVQRVEPVTLPDVPVPVEAAVPVEKSPALEDLYGRVARAEEDYRIGVEQIAAGEEVGGEGRIVAATAEIRGAAAECDDSQYQANRDKLVTVQVNQCSKEAAYRQ